MTRKALILAVLLLVGSALVFAGNESTMGVGKVKTVTFSQPMKVGTSVLPVGTYTVAHVMEGANHIMVFSSKTKGVPQVRVQCTMKTLVSRAPQSSIMYDKDASGVAVLNGLIFKGDTYSHNF